MNKRVPTSLEVSSEASVPIHLALRRQVLQDLGELGKIGSELTNLFTRLHAEVEHVTAQVEQGVRAIDIGNSIGVSNKRLLVNNAIVAMREARHRWQRSMFLLAVEEGSSLAEVARTWGVSRQLVSRMVKEGAEA